jgi:hypothetical protein
MNSSHPLSLVTELKGWEEFFGVWTELARETHRLTAAGREGCSHLLARQLGQPGQDTTTICFVLDLLTS